MRSVDGKEGGERWFGRGVSGRVELEMMECGKEGKEGMNGREMMDRREM